MLDETILQAQLGRCLESTDLTTWATLPVLRGATRYVGKVRDNYTLDELRVIVVSDRISAFDRVLGTIPFKGQVLNQMATYWFAKTRHLVRNHFIASPDPAVTVALGCTPLPVEFVMRGYLTGVTTTSVWHHYQKGARVFCGHRLPEGMKKNEPLPEPLLTPSTKAEKGGHDESLSQEEILGRGILDEASFDAAAGLARTLFAFGQARAAERGLILVDTKYEIGRAPDGGLVVIDEIHTPDSSRYWYADDYEQRLRTGEDPRSLDKEYVRRWYAAQGYTGDGVPPPLTDEVRSEAARRYVEAYERITGQRFVPDTSDPLPRIRHHLEGFFAQHES
ncbi:MAG TPA: phosphoribosylaminoimidazolesuccinocarboxamide synthase [Polyangia bacterium]|jgi:phosphoribosylaminoimidazole-succinocarboxamide synthase|nr:phosphoribosylaminoimidazolesuccinocarboxamide synthase [Polyangia bacterium]